MHPGLAGPELAGRFGYWLLGWIFIPVFVAGAIGYSIKSRKVVLLSTLTAAIPLVIGAFSHDASLRYHYASAILLFGVASYLALSPAGPRKKLRVGVITAVAAFCWLWNIGTIFFPEYTPQLLPVDPLKEFFYPISPQERNPAEYAVDVLADHLPRRPLQAMIYPFFPPELMLYFEVPDYLSAAAQARGLDWKFGMGETPVPATDAVILIMSKNDSVNYEKVLQSLPAWKVTGEIPWPGGPVEGHGEEALVRIFSRK